MNSVLSDELLSINAIYASNTLTEVKDSQGVYILQIPNCDVSLRVQFHENYPEREPPIIIGPESSGTETRKGEANEVVLIARNTLKQCFRAGEPCIFDLIEEIEPKLQQKYDTVKKERHRHQDHENTAEDTQADLQANEDANDCQMSAIEPPWVLSDVVTEKKSIFVARAAHVANVDEAQLYIQHLISTDRKVAKATHNISAWRIQDRKGEELLTYQDFDDDGETAAGGRLLHLLQLMDVWNVIVVVSRWYGGIQLGPDRFRLINSVARDAVTKVNFTERGRNKTTVRAKERK